MISKLLTKINNALVGTRHGKRMGVRKINASTQPK
jgi:hypothetical protein